MPCRLYLVNCLANYSSYLIPRFYPLQFATIAGASPHQTVFGRNPRVPQDLLQQDVHVPAVDSTLFETASQKAAAIRQSARMAILQCQDEKALKAALRARPRPHREFNSGDWVYYWRSQKWQQGQLVKGERGHGAAMILGLVSIL